MGICGLILGGGESRRMGQDKALIRIKGRTLAEIQYEYLGPFVQKTFFSGPEIDDPFMLNIPDMIPGLGPLGGIYSALKHYPDNAFFSLPVDVYLEDAEPLRALIKERDTSANGTILYNKATEKPEPLMGIYEPACLLSLKEAISSNKLKARRFVTENDFKMVPLSPSWKNINTPGDLEALLDHQS